MGSNLKEEILEVLHSLPREPGHPIQDYVLDAVQIRERIMAFRVAKALEELETERRIKWDEKGQGWRLS